MTPKQRAFCDYYLASGNATEAAEKAGYSAKTAYSIGAENLRKPEIQQFIEAHSKPKEESRIATAQEVLEFYSEVMRDREEMTKNRLRAAENLAKRFGVDKERATGDGAVQITLSIEDMSGGEDAD